jgi:hypothetical protein
MRPTAVVSIVVLLCLIAATPLGAGQERGDGAALLWEIGKADRGNAEFALAPGGFREYGEDGFYVVGLASAKQSWPYVHPGPADAWAGSRPHTFSVLFGVQRPAAAGSCRLLVDLLDTQSKAPPRLLIQINDQAFEQQMPRGAGDASVRGEPASGRPCHFAVEFPAALLRAGSNRIDIVNAAGSWVLYDHLALETPATVEGQPAPDYTALTSVEVSPALVQREGNRCQRVAATVLRSGPAVEAAIRLGAKDVDRVRLHAGRQSIEILAPIVRRPEKTTLALLSGGRTLASQEITLTPGLAQVIIVFKTHFDIGYTDMAVNVVQRYRTTMIDQALEVVDQNRGLPPEQQFVWTIPGWPASKILEDWPGQTPERRRRIERALKEGRFAVHALPFTTHTELLEAEDLVRGLGYSSRLSRALGLDLPLDAKMTDVPEHTWMLATLLHHAGVEFMHIGCNGASAALRVPPLYWWEGPDGSRVLTMYSPAYGTQLMPPEGWPYRTWLALIHTGDNHGPPRPEEVQPLLDQAAKRLPGVKVRIGRLADFARAVLDEKTDLPVVRGDSPDTWIHGPMSDPAGARLARNTRPRIAAAESLNTQLSAWGNNLPDAAPAIAAAYEQSLLYGEHTWGGSISWIGRTLSFGDAFRRDRAAGRFARIESSWEEHSAYVQNAQQIIAPVLQENLAALARSVAASGRRIVVYNPLPWARDGLVTIERAANGISAMRPAEGGPALPVEPAGQTLRFVARDVPALGYRTYVPVKAESAPASGSVDAGAATMENSLFKVVLDPVRGVVRSLIEKHTGRELVDADAAVGLGQFLYERFDRDQVEQWCKTYLKPERPWNNAAYYKPGLPPAGEVAYQAGSPHHFAIRFQRTPLAVSAEMQAKADQRIPCGVTTRVVLYHDLPCVDVEFTVHDKPLEPWPEAGWLCLPLRIPEPQFRLGRLGSVIDPAKDIIPGSNRHLFGINTGLTLTDAGGQGVGICPLDYPLVSLETPGCWKFSLDFVPRKPIVYVNLFNNQWDTNFRLWNEGSWTSRVRLWAIHRYDAEASLITPSLEARYQLEAAIADGPAGKLPLAQAGLTLSRKGVLVTAFGASPDGPGRLLRLWEYAGRSGECQIWLPAGMEARSAQPVDLRGRPAGRPLVIEDRRLRVELPAFAPKTLLLTPGRSRSS